MTDLLKLYRAENIWGYVTNQKRFISDNKVKEHYYACVLNFARMCSLEALGKDVVNKELDEDFVNTYNQIAKGLFECVKVGSKISLNKVGNKIKHEGIFNEGIAAVCYGDFYNIKLKNAPNLAKTPIEEYLTDENRVKIIYDFCRCLVGLRQLYGDNVIDNLFSATYDYVL